ncbi:hypothetical protein HKD37_17G048307 [Glycine soja]
MFLNKKKGGGGGHKPWNFNRLIKRQTAPLLSLQNGQVTKSNRTYTLREFPERFAKDWIRFPTSRAQSFWMIGPLDESISCFLIKVDPWVLVPITFRGLYVLAIRGLHILACRGLHALAFRGLRVLIFSPLPLDASPRLALLVTGTNSFLLSVPGPPPDIGGQPTVRAHPEREAIVHLLCIPGQDFTRAAAKRRQHSAQRPQCQSPPANVSVGLCRHDIGIVPTRRPVDLKKSNRALGFPALVTGLYQSYRVPVPPARSCHRDIGITPTKTPSGPGEVQQGPGESRPQDTQWTRRSPTGSWSCQALITGLCQFYRVHVAPNKVIRPHTNRAFIKKYCVPRQAQGETPQQPGDGRQRAIDAPPSPLEFTSTHPQKG